MSKLQFLTVVAVLVLHLYAMVISARSWER
jgi:hypothetical protein